MEYVLIGLDPGHGLKTAGKQTPNGIKEWTLNDAVANKIELRLKGYNAKILRLDNNEGNVDESLTNRLQRYINAKVDVMVSLHHNALGSTWSKATGVETYTDLNPTAMDVKLASLIQKKMVAYTGLPDRGVKKAAFYVINQNKVTAVLVEGGFMDGEEDYKVITSDIGQEAYARAVAESLIELYDLKRIGGWQQDDEGWQYIETDGKFVKSQWVKDSVDWCYIGADGYMLTNAWQKDSSGWCYVGEDGRLVRNKWQQDSNGWCYLDESGHAVKSNWKLIKDKWYYFNDKANMITGLQTIKGAVYYFADDGHMCRTNDNGALV